MIDLKILFVSYEVYPLAKVGGLADVAGSLPKALKGLGLDIDVLMPFHGSISEKGVENTGGIVCTESMKERYEFGVYLTKLPSSDVDVYLLKNDVLMDSREVYGSSNLGLQAMAFSDAAAAFAAGRGYDIVHLNDWHTGLMAVYLKERKAYPGTIISIHNLAYQGVYPEEYFELSGIAEENRDAVCSGESLNCLKAGLVFADMITTVSPTYAKEIQTQEYGAGLDGVLEERSDVLAGILNGIDFGEYDPATDKRLSVNFDSNTIDKKIENKRALQREVGLPESEDAVLGLISRLVDQKGLDLLAEIKDELMKLPVQLVILGTGEKKYEAMFKALQQEFPDKMAAMLTFNLDLAQKIYGGADMFLMPSRYEPCGLGQMFAMRYGTIPIVRYTGGLADTVQEFDLSSLEGNGFGFNDYSSAGLLESLKRALEIYKDGESWRRLVLNAMSGDFSWGASARNYLAVYEKTLEVKKRCLN